jgi:hypothetical protein
MEAAVEPPVPVELLVECPMGAPVEAIMEATMEFVISVEYKDATSEEAWTRPIVPRIARNPIIIIAVAVGRQILHSIAAGVHTLRVSDVIACL